MSMILQQLTNGVMSGSLYALIGLGLTLVYGVMELSNFAHGEFVMMGAYVTYFMTVSMGMNYFEALLIAALAGVIIGVIINILAFDPLMKGNPINMMISSLGVSTLLVNLAQYLFTADPRKMETAFTSEVIQLGPISFTQQRLLIFVLSLCLSFAVYFIVKKTKFGSAIRATSTDPTTAKLYGVNTEKVALFAFIIGTTLAAVAGGLMGPSYTVSPTMGTALTTKSFVVVVLGGMGSIPGAIAGGFIIGLIEAIGGLFSTKYVDMIVYLILFVVLIVRPQGIFTQYRREKV